MIMMTSGYALEIIFWVVITLYVLSRLGVLKK